MKVSAITSNTNMSYTNDKNNSNKAFKANLKVHNEVITEISRNALYSGKDPFIAKETLMNILIKASEKVKPLAPNVDVTLGSTRKANNDFMVYTQMPGAPIGMILNKVIGELSLEAQEASVEKIVNATKVLLAGIRMYSGF